MYDAAGLMSGVAFVVDISWARAGGAVRRTASSATANWRRPGIDGLDCREVDFMNSMGVEDGSLCADPIAMAIRGLGCPGNDQAGGSSVGLGAECWCPVALDTDWIGDFSGRSPARYRSAHPWLRKTVVQGPPPACRPLETEGLAHGCVQAVRRWHGSGHALSARCNWMGKIGEESRALREQSTGVCGRVRWTRRRPHGTRKPGG